MIRTILACVLLLSACTHESSAHGGARPAVAVATDAKAVLELGREICQGCVDGAREKLTGVEGIGELTLNPGGKDFTVCYDSKKVTPAQIAAKLVAAGEADAKVKP